jgi:hypothetical protein
LTCAVLRGCIVYYNDCGFSPRLSLACPIPHPNDEKIGPGRGWAADQMSLERDTLVPQLPGYGAIDNRNSLAGWHWQCTCIGQPDNYCLTASPHLNPQLNISRKDRVLAVRCLCCPDSDTRVSRETFSIHDALVTLLLSYQVTWGSKRVIWLFPTSKALFTRVVEN